MRRIFFLSAALLLAFNLVTAEEFWQKTDYHRWSKEDCDRLLQKSPWAQRYGFAKAVMTPVASDDVEAGRAANEQIHYIIQLRSALPVRQAVVRQALLQAKIDRRTPAEKRSMEEQADKFVSAPSSAVIVHVIYGSNIPNYHRDLHNYWAQQTLDTVKNTMALIGAQGRIVPIDFQLASGGAAEFEVIFPRTLNGQPLVTSTDKTLAFEFTHPPIGSFSSGGNSRARLNAADPSDSGHVLVQFKVKDMIMDGKVVY